MTAGSCWSSSGAWDKFSNLEQPQWFLHSHSSALSLLPGLSLSHFCAFPPSINTSSPAVFQTFPPKHPPSRYTQQTLPVLLCPSKLNSSRELGRDTYPKSKAGKKPLKISCAGFSSWRDAQQCWAGMGSGRLPWSGLGRKPCPSRHRQVGTHCTPGAGIIPMTWPLHNQHLEHVTTSSMQRFPWWYKYCSLIV